MTAKVQTFGLTLSTLSPVFIGGGEQATLSPYTDFIQQGDQLIIVDQQKLQAELAKNPSSIDEFVQGIRGGFDNNRSVFSLSAFITKSLGLQLSQIERCRLPVGGEIRKNQIRRFIASSGKAFIPGSSLKGAIRTAVLLDWLLKTPSGKQQLVFIRKLVEQKEWKELKRCNPAKECFGNISRDVFKYLRISDSATFDHASLSVSEIKRVSIQQQNGNAYNRKADIPLWSEALKPEVQTTAALSLLQPAESTGFPFLDQQSISNLLHIINGQSRESCERERNELENAPKEFASFKRFYDKLFETIESIDRPGSQEAIVRLGSGKTWFDNSIGFAIDQEDFGTEELFATYLKLIKIGHLPFPSTRSVVFENGAPNTPLGWVKISINQ